MIIVALCAVRESTVMVSYCVLGIVSDRLAVIRDCAIVVALGAVSEAPVVVGFNVPRIELDRFAVVCNRVIIIPLGAVAAPAIVVGDCILGVESDGLAVFSDGAVVITLGGVSEAADEGDFGSSEIASLEIVRSDSPFRMYSIFSPPAIRGLEGLRPLCSSRLRMSALAKANASLRFVVRRSAVLKKASPK